MLILWVGFVNQKHGWIAGGRERRWKRKGRVAFTLLLIYDTTPVGS